MEREITVQGNLGKDAEVRQTSEGKPFVTFSVAYTDYWKTPEENTLWYRVTVFGTSANDGGYQFKAAAALKKGERVQVRGKYRTKPYNGELQHEVTANMLTRVATAPKSETTIEAPF